MGYINDIVNKLKNLKNESKVNEDKLYKNMIYKGTWNASSNMPSMPISEEKNSGWYYKVTIKGTTGIDGIEEWNTGDIIVSNGSTWEIIKYSDQRHVNMDDEIEKDKNIGSLYYIGAWDASKKKLPENGKLGHFYIINMKGTMNWVDYHIGDWIIYNGEKWERFKIENNVISVNEKTGVITLNSSDILEDVNLYYTEDRVSNNINVFNNTDHSNSHGNPHRSTTDDIKEGMNKYFHDSRVSSSPEVKNNISHRKSKGNVHNATTSDFPEGKNLYYTEDRVAKNFHVKDNTKNKHNHDNKNELDFITDGKHDSKKGNIHNLRSNDIEDLNNYITNHTDVMSSKQYIHVPNKDSKLAEGTDNECTAKDIRNHLYNLKKHLSINDEATSENVAWSSAKLNILIDKKCDKAHTHKQDQIEDLDCYKKDEINEFLENKSDQNHAHKNIYYSRNDIDSLFDGETAGKKLVNWYKVTNKPTTFEPSKHDHDEYYSKDSIDSLFEGTNNDKKLVNWVNITKKPELFEPSKHNHNNIYYTEDEVDSIINKLLYEIKGNVSTNLNTLGKISKALSHNPDFSSVINTKLENKSGIDHDHEDIYYSKEDLDGSFDGDFLGKKRISWEHITNKPGGYVPVDHNHENIYYSKMDFDEFFDGTSQGKKQINWNRIINIITLIEIIH